MRSDAAELQAAHRPVEPSLSPRNPSSYHRSLSLSGAARRFEDAGRHASRRLAINVRGVMIH